MQDTNTNSLLHSNFCLKTPSGHKGIFLRTANRNLQTAATKYGRAKAMNNQNGNKQSPPLLNALSHLHLPTIGPVTKTNETEWERVSRTMQAGVHLSPYVNGAGRREAFSRLRTGQFKESASPRHELMDH